MPFSIKGFAEREGLKHLGYREANYQHWQGLQPPLFFPQRPGPCRARFSSSWRHFGVTVLQGKGSFLLGFPGSSWQGLGIFWLVGFVLLVLYCFGILFVRLVFLFVVFFWVFFPFKQKVVLCIQLWYYHIQLLLYLNLQLLGFSIKHGCFGL